MSDEILPTLFCYNHPQRETMLRCNRCERPICIQCAVLTPTGYRCKECVRGQQKVFETAVSYDYVFAIGIAGVLSFLASNLAGVMGFFTLFIAPIAGVVIAEAVRWATRRRRSKLLFQITTGAAVLGSLPLLGLHLISLLLSFAGLWGLIWQAVFTFMVASSVYYRLSGIRAG
jgi:MFS family permease